MENSETQQPQFFLLKKNSKPSSIKNLKLPSDEEYLWIDIIREHSPDWAASIQKKLKIKIYDNHIIDSLNETHPSFHDSTSTYDLIILQGLLPGSQAQDFSFHPTAFFLFENIIISIRPERGVSIKKIAQQLMVSPGKTPQQPLGLLHLFLSAMVDRFLVLREPLNELFEEWQQNLLDPSHPFNDWMELLNEKKRMRKLMRISEAQQDTVISFIESSPVELNDSYKVRFNDLLEHIRRVYNQAQRLESEIETLIQVHFSSVAHRTNEIMRVLTVLTALFLPLTFIAGLFGMNFEYMPELKYKYSYFIVLGFMFCGGVGLFYYFKRKKWL